MNAGRETGQSANEWAAARLRSEGTFSAEEIAWCRANGIEMGYCPIQHGLVPVACIDDLVGPHFVPAASLQLQSEADGLVFRRWQLSDAETFADLLTNERVWQYLPDPFPGSIDRRAAEDLITLSREGEHHDVYAVQHGAVVVGQTRLLFDLAAPERSSAEISYWLGERYWGQKLGSRIVAAFTRASFSRWPDLRTIVARVHAHNHASERVLVKSGYVRADKASPADPWRLFRCERRLAS